MNQPNIHYHPNWLNLDQSDQLFKNLSLKINWQTEEIKIFGKTQKVPRLISFCGDQNINYRYSGKNHQCTGWFKDLLPIKNRLLEEGYDFNFVLLNYYRDGQDYMGWHSDDEKELGLNPMIASVSLGEERKFNFRLKKNHQIKYSINLESGSLLLMKENVQKNWQHSLPKTKKAYSPRINLTFRKIN
jgi:alkylated DNA repair dioxygenase AlkB